MNIILAKITKENKNLLTLSPVALCCFDILAVAGKALEKYMKKVEKKPQQIISSHSRPELFLKW